MAALVLNDRWALLAAALAMQGCGSEVTVRGGGPNDDDPAGEDEGPVGDEAPVHVDVEAPVDACVPGEAPSTIVEMK